MYSGSIDFRRDPATRMEAYNGVVLPRALTRLLQWVTVTGILAKGLSPDLRASKYWFSDGESNSNNSSSNGSTFVFVLLGLVLVGLLSFYLFKIWQRKKREEQYARLLKLFEEDDELELELGLRD